MYREEITTSSSSDLGTAFPVHRWSQVRAPGTSGLGGWFLDPSIDYDYGVESKAISITTKLNKHLKENINV